MERQEDQAQEVSQDHLVHQDKEVNQAQRDNLDSGVKLDP